MKGSKINKFRIVQKFDWSRHSSRIRFENSTKILCGITRCPELKPERAPVEATLKRRYVGNERVSSCSHCGQIIGITKVNRKA